MERKARRGDRLGQDENGEILNRRRRIRKHYPLNSAARASAGIQLSLGKPDPRDRRAASPRQFLPRDHPVIGLDKPLNNTTARQNAPPIKHHPASERLKVIRPSMDSGHPPIDRRMRTSDKRRQPTLIDDYVPPGDVPIPADLGVLAHRITLPLMLAPHRLLLRV
jgi:hypothetical protein